MVSVGFLSTLLTRRRIRHEEFPAVPGLAGRKKLWIIVCSAAKPTGRNPSEIRTLIWFPE
jgi:hypothetical protein